VEKYKLAIGSFIYRILHDISIDCLEQIKKSLQMASNRQVLCDVATGSI